MGSFFDKAKAQGTVEYLLIIGAAVGLVCLAAILFFSVFDVGSQNPNLDSIKNKQFWSTQSIALADAVVDGDGDAILAVTNNTDYPLQVTGYQVNGEIFEIDVPINLKPREEKGIFMSHIGQCIGNKSCYYDKVIFFYKSLDSTQRLQSGGNALLLAKSEDITWQLAGPTSMVCVSRSEVSPSCSGEISIDTNTQTVHWTDSTGKWLIDLNTNGNLKASGGYLCNDVNCYKISNLGRESSNDTNTQTIGWTNSTGAYLIDLNINHKNVVDINAIKISDGNYAIYKIGNDIWISDGS